MIYIIFLHYMMRILFIDDDTKAHTILRMILPPECHLISTYRGSQGLELLKADMPDIVLLDVDLPDADGFCILQKIVTMPLAPPVIMLTALSETRAAVRAIRQGAADYVEKPFRLDDLMQAIRSNVTYSDGYAEDSLFEDFIGESSIMKKVKQMLLLYAQSDKPTLITGESGTGKDVAARTIHRLSKRHEGPYITKNCAAIPFNLFESELFGSERGAFTDAVSRSGCFELASGGTLFLDEIGEIPSHIQVKLLRAFEDNTLVRIGGVKSHAVDFRAISACNIDLVSALKENRFRLDLYYRISTLPLYLPPLRERTEDIPLLAEHLLRTSHAAGEISVSAMEKLCSYQWPGNIRELRNIIDRAVLFSEGKTIEPKHLLINL